MDFYIKSKGNTDKSYFWNTFDFYLEIKVQSVTFNYGVIIIWNASDFYKKFKGDADNHDNEQGAILTQCPSIYFLIFIFSQKKNLLG